MVKPPFPGNKQTILYYFIAGGAIAAHHVIMASYYPSFPTETV